MKSTINEVGRQPEVIKFPILMQFKRNNALIVLFHAPHKGVIVNEGSSGPSLGSYSEDLLDFENWEVFKGTITLEN